MASDAPTPQHVGRPDSSLPVFIDSAASSQTQLALRDLYQGFSNFRLWSIVGWRDIKQRYRRSTLGPLWVTLNMAFMVLALGLIYGTIFKIRLSIFLPYICLGLIVWDFIAKCISEGSIAYLEQEGLIKQFRIPFSTHIARYIWRNVVVFGHNFIIYLIVAVVFSVNPGWHLLLALPGAVLLVFNVTWMAMLLAILCARFRDVPMLIQTTLQMMFFVTPVFWLPTLVPHGSALVHANPFFHLIESIRSPLLGLSPAIDTWLVLVGLLVFGWTATFLLFIKFRRRITYWL